MFVIDGFGLGSFPSVVSGLYVVIFFFLSVAAAASSLNLHSLFHKVFKMVRRTGAGVVAGLVASEVPPGLDSLGRPIDPGQQLRGRG